MHTSVDPAQHTAQSPTFHAHIDPVTAVEFFVDPACMWSWWTWRWLASVASIRAFDVRIRPYSLFLRETSKQQPALDGWKRPVWQASLRAVRVLQALDATGDTDGAKRLWTELIQDGAAAFADQRPQFTDPATVLGTAGLPAELAAAADDPALDEDILAGMAEMNAVIGTGVGTPALILCGGAEPVGVHGPMLGSAVDLPEALHIWEAVALFARSPALLELSRPRPRRPPMYPIAIPTQLKLAQQQLT